MALSQERDFQESKNVSPSSNETDLPDSAEDQKAMEEEETIIDLPDVADIPGQENIVPPKMGMFVDTTISSDGEEGTELFDESNEEES